jgi:hypothetical protein
MPMERRRQYGIAVKNLRHVKDEACGSKNELYRLLRFYPHPRSPNEDQSLSEALLRVVQWRPRHYAEA